MEKNIITSEVNIHDIKPGDTVFHNGQQRTVCRNNIIDGGFMGRTLFGDSYLLGRKPVIKIDFIKG